MLKQTVTNLERVWRLLIAANDEALRAGHTHVDSDHVLLGLLVIDGESARQLRSAGLNLDSARTAMAAIAPDGNCRLTLSLRVDRGGRHRLLDRADDKTTAIRLNLIAQALAQAS